MAGALLVEGRFGRGRGEGQQGGFAKACVDGVVFTENSSLEKHDLSAA
tara:strand:- start:480 stop:623 length:144 start_codon:yes stop_codon:yes gene_type:complete